MPIADLLLAVTDLAITEETEKIQAEMDDMASELETLAGKVEYVVTADWGPADLVELMGIEPTTS